jgi:hypothetical protein
MSLMQKSFEDEEKPEDFDLPDDFSALLDEKKKQFEEPGATFVSASPAISRKTSLATEDNGIG